VIRRFPSDLACPRRVRGHGTAATRMSRFGSIPDRGFGRKCPDSNGMVPMARRVHFAPTVLLIVVATALLTGCPPPPLSLDEPDAAPNSAPGITSVRNESGEEFHIGTEANSVIAGPASQSSMTLTVVDSDIEDTLYVRGFLDYRVDAPSSALAVCNVGPSTPRSQSRTVTCSLAAYCTAADIPTSPHRMDIVVSDRLPDDSGVLVPPRYAVPPPGLQATRTYVIQCQESPT